MEKAIETLKVEFNGLSAYIDAYYDDVVPGDDIDFGDKDAEREYIERFERGELLMLCVQVSIYDKSGNVEGLDSLGACHVNANDVLNDVQEIVKDHSMLDGAFSDLETKIKAICGSCEVIS